MCGLQVSRSVVSPYGNDVGAATVGEAKCLDVGNEEAGQF